MESSSASVHIVGEDLLRASYKLVCLPFCVSSDQWKKKSVAEILQRIRETFLYENNRNYNSYKFNCKFAFIPFLLFRRNQKQESNFQQVGGQAKRNISVFCL